MKKVAIIGGGPAGYTSAIYLSRAGYWCDIYSSKIPSQISLATTIDNYPGFIGCPYELLENMEKQVKQYNVKFWNSSIETFSIRKGSFGKEFLVNNNPIRYDGVVICTGASHKKIGSNFESKFDGKGVSYCAVCDGFLYKDKDVMVIGGGDTALSDALYLSSICNKIYLVHRRNEFRASKELQDKVRQTENIEIILDAQVIQADGDKDGLLCSADVIKKYSEEKGWFLLDGEKMSKVFSVSGIFIAVGQNPNTKLFDGIIDMDENKYIIDYGYGKTNINGIVAAGDCLNYKYKQVVTACASGCNAAMTLNEQLK